MTKPLTHRVYHGAELIAERSSYDDAWRVIHEQSHGASVEWQMKNEGWRIEEISEPERNRAEQTAAVARVAAKRRDRVLGAAALAELGERLESVVAMNRDAKVIDSDDATDLWDAAMVLQKYGRRLAPAVTDATSPNVSGRGSVHEGCGGTWEAPPGEHDYGLIDRCTKCGEERA